MRTSKRQDIIGFTYRPDNEARLSNEKTRPTLGTIQISLLDPQKDKSYQDILRHFVNDADAGPDTNASEVEIAQTDATNFAVALRTLLRHAEQGSLDHIVDLLEKDNITLFHELKTAVRPFKVGDVQYQLAQRLNDIEARASEYPLVTPKDASRLLGELSATNPSRLVATLKAEHKLFAFNFGDAKSVQVPAFQFKPDLGVFSVVPKLCRILSGLNDWGVYHWFTTYSPDLDCSPAEALAISELGDDLVYLAGLFKSSSTLRELSFDAVNHSEVDPDGDNNG